MRAVFVFVLAIVLFSVHARAEENTTETVSDGLVWVGIERHVWAWAVGGTFAILACLVSFNEIRLHLHNNHDDHVRKWVIRVFLMVPFYAIEAWLGLYAREYTEWWDLARECYEAYAIYAFFMFLMHALGGETKLVMESDSDHHVHKHMVPFCCADPWPNAGGKFIRNCSTGVLQYVPIKLITAGCQFGLTKAGLFHTGTFSGTDSYIYLAIVTNCSQLCAMYCLVLFLHAFDPALQKYRPLPKLLCIKLVVFFTFWQAIVIAGLVHIGTITETKTYSVEEAAAGFQDFIICIEMFLAAIAHKYAFPPKEFYDEEKAKVQRPMLHKMFSVIKQGDILNHVTKTVMPQSGGDKSPKQALVKIDPGHGSSGVAVHGDGGGEGGTEMVVASDPGWEDSRAPVGAASGTTTPAPHAAEPTPAPAPPAESSASASASSPSGGLPPPTLKVEVSVGLGHH